MSFVYIERRNYIKYGIFVYMKEEFFFEKEMNLLEFFKIKIKGNVFFKIRLYVNIVLFKKYIYSYI